MVFVRYSNRRFKKLESRKINRSLGQKRHAIQNVQEHKGRLEEQFEPSILADRYMMEKDVKIQETDVPERMQVEAIRNALVCLWVLTQVFIASRVIFVAAIRNESLLSSYLSTSRRLLVLFLSLATTNQLRQIGYMRTCLAPCLVQLSLNFNTLLAWTSKRLFNK